VVHRGLTNSVRSRIEEPRKEHEEALQIRRELSLNMWARIGMDRSLIKRPHP
jgi:hypothetical protein